MKLHRQIDMIEKEKSGSFEKQHWNRNLWSEHHCTQKITETLRNLMANHNENPNGFQSNPNPRIIFYLQKDSNEVNGFLVVKPQLCSYGKLPLNIPFSTLHAAKLSP